MALIFLNKFHSSGCIACFIACLLVGFSWLQIGALIHANLRLKRYRTYPTRKKINDFFVPALPFGMQSQGHCQRKTETSSNCTLETVLRVTSAPIIERQGLLLVITCRSRSLCARNQHHQGGHWRSCHCSSSDRFCTRHHRHSRYKRSCRRRIFVVSQLA